MYLWNIDKLIKDLKNDKLPPKNIRLYSILSPLLSIFNAIFFGVVLVIHQIIANIFKHFLSAPDPYITFYSKLGWFMGTFATCLTFLGFYLCYRTNKQGDGKDFFKRLACLSFPIYFHLTVYILAFITLILFFGFAFFQTKLLYFKYQLFLQSKSDSTIADVIHLALKDSLFESLLIKTAKKSSFLRTIFSAPIALIRIPLIPGKITAFLIEIRSNLLTIYPFLTILPPALAMTHYLVVRRMLRKVCGAKK